MRAVWNQTSQSKPKWSMWRERRTGAEVIYWTLNKVKTLPPSFWFSQGLNRFSADQDLVFYPYSCYHWRLLSCMYLTPKFCLSPGFSPTPLVGLAPDYSSVKVARLLVFDPWSSSMRTYIHTCMYVFVCIQANSLSTRHQSIMVLRVCVCQGQKHK